MSTRIGRYIFDINLANMDIEKLNVLKEGCEYFIKEKRKGEIHRAITATNLLAHSYGFDIMVRDADDNEICLNELTLDIKDRD